MLLFLFFIFSVNGFTHEAPGEPCTNTHFPEDANEANTYDYIFVGAGATSTVTASKLALDSGCEISILIIEAGRSFTQAPMNCNGEIDCFVQETENEYHQSGAGFPFQALQTRSNWPYISRPQAYVKEISYSDGRTDNCPFSAPETFIPPGCLCTSDRQSILGQVCPISRECLINNGGNTTLCGLSACLEPAICARNGTNLYWRTASKGGSNAHHAQFTYPMSPYVAQKWVEITGDQRFTFDKWQSAFQTMDSEWLHISFTANHFSPIGTMDNDTFKYLMQQAAVETLGINDLSTGANRVTNSDEFFSPDIETKYYQGYAGDQCLGRQVNRLTGDRSFPGNYLDQAMGVCPTSLITTCDSLVTKLLFDDQGTTLSRRAIGVEYIEGGNNFKLDWNHDPNLTAQRMLTPSRAFARKGVVLGGGVFNSPHLLMLNGIGPQHHLEQFGIPVRKHLPAVGQNLQDDNEYALNYRVTATGDPKAINNTVDPEFGNRPYWVPDVFKALFGMNASHFDPTTGAPLAPPFATDSYCHPDAVAHGGRDCPLIPGSSYVIPPDGSYLSSFLGDGHSFYHDSVPSGRGTFYTYFRNETERAQRKNPTCLAICIPGLYIKGWYDLIVNYGGAAGSQTACVVVNTDPKSRGSVFLRSADPTDPVVVDPNLWSSPEDIAHDADCVNHMRRTVDRFNELSTQNPSLYGNIQMSPFKPESYSSPDDNIPRNETTPELIDFMSGAIWNHHPTGTNMMGNIHTENSVVDSRGRVWGTSNLYIIDMSTIAYHMDFFPSINAMALGFIQAETLLANNPPDSRTCNVNSFRGVRTADQLDTTPNPLVAPLVTGWVFVAFLLLMGIGLAVYFNQGRSSGYKKL